MAAISIRVGAARDASLATAFAPLEAAARKARATLGAEAKATAAAEVRETRRAAKDREREYAALFDQIAKKEKDETRVAQREEKERVKATEKAMREKARLVEQEARAFDRAERQKTVAAERAARETARSAGTAARAQSRADAQAQRQAARQIAKDGRRATKGGEEKLAVGHTVGTIAAQLGRTALSYGGRAVSTGLQGAGVDLSASSAISKSVDLEASATKVTNSAYMPGHAGNAGRRQDPKELMADVRNVANTTATETQVAMDALDKFVAKTGDLQTGRDMLGSIATISKAYGADLSDMADAAGDVANQIGDVPHKAQAVADVMKLITAQGKEGAVEIKDLATQMAKVAAAAGQFEGDKSKNIALFGALTQNTRARGGAASSTQAATSVTSFMNTFSKGARLKAFKGFGVETQGAGGQNRNAEDIIFDSIQAAASKKNGGMKDFSSNMGKMFMDVRARSVTRGFESSFQENYAKAQGTEQERITTAISQTREEFDRLKTSTMEDRELQDSFGAAMKTTQSQTQILNNRLADSAGQLDGALKPAIISLANSITPVVSGLAMFLAELGGGQKPATTADAALGGINTLNGIGANALASGQISKEDYGELLKRREELAVSISDQQTDANSSVFHSASDQFLAGYSKTGELGSSAAGNLLSERKNIASDRELLAKLDGVIAATKANNDPDAILKVQIVGGNIAPPAVDQGGRTPSGTGAPSRKPNK